ncbi:hypothetical protein [Paenibacillus sp. MDMC362]|uniref:hypothetical protein n=1 Tax=Paenibacillus sp. MDMC362 TaxID=2977365 RepID=UPI000DC5E7CA|nr:hypothetical protein [Paenibacillus sp. MDMC362]RAR44785.1 hypothetical protein DP091_06370 [Paenibacillus sp. MDMC362]
MNRKKRILSITMLLVIAYVLFGLWIAHDTKLILKKAMSGAADYADYMNSSTYRKINPAERELTDKHFVYDKQIHQTGFVFPLHFFFVSDTFVTQQYENKEFGFKEPIRLKLRLKSGKWYATDAFIQP